MIKLSTYLKQYKYVFFGRISGGRAIVVQMANSAPGSETSSISRLTVPFRRGKRRSDCIFSAARGNAGMPGLALRQRTTIASRTARS